MASTVLQHIRNLPRPLAFVFSGGASFGAIQAGQLQALHEAGVEPDLLVGASAGALNAAFFALRPDQQRAEELTNLWRSLQRSDLFPGGSARLLGRLLIGRNSLFGQRGLHALLTRVLPDVAIEDLALPLGIVATDLALGEGVVFRSGDLRERLLASAAIPGVYPPVKMDGSWYVDGGVVSNIPLMPAVAMGAKSLLVLEAGYACGLASSPPGMLDILGQVSAISSRQRPQAMIDQVSQDHPVVVLPTRCPIDLSPLDFSRGASLVQEGALDTRQFLQADFDEQFQNNIHHHASPSGFRMA